MIVQAWNVNGRGTPAALALGVTLCADVLLLQEADLATAPGWMSIGSDVHGNGWGSGIFVRDGSLTEIVLAGNAGWVAGAKWTRSRDGHQESTFLFSIHSPTPREGNPRRSYVAESRAIVEAISSSKEIPPDARVIVGGDFNFKSLGERLDSEPISTTADEVAALNAFRDANYCVAWKDLNASQPLPQTLRWSGDQAQLFHCDGFLLKGIDVSSAHCAVLSTAMLTKCSDHLPVVVWITDLSHVGVAQ